MPPDPRDDLTTEERNEADRLKELKRQREVHEAFETVFGRAGSRTVHQARVLEFLAQYVGPARNPMRMDGHDAVDVPRTMASLGQRSMLAEIWHRINWTEGGSNVDTSG